MTRGGDGAIWVGRDRDGRGRRRARRGRRHDRRRGHLRRGPDRRALGGRAPRRRAPGGRPARRDEVEGCWRTPPGPPRSPCRGRARTRRTATSWPERLVRLRSCSQACTRGTTEAPSPLAAATRFIEPGADVAGSEDAGDRGGEAAGRQAVDPPVLGHVAAGEHEARARRGRTASGSQSQCGSAPSSRNSPRASRRSASPVSVSLDGRATRAGRRRRRRRPRCTAAPRCVSCSRSR